MSNTNFVAINTIHIVASDLTIHVAVRISWQYPVIFNILFTSHIMITNHSMYNTLYQTIHSLMTNMHKYNKYVSIDTYWLYIVST